MIVDSLKNAWNVADLRKKIGYTLLMFLIFRIGAHIPIPFVDPRRSEEYAGSPVVCSILWTHFPEVPLRV